MVILSAKFGPMFVKYLQFRKVATPKGMVSEEELISRKNYVVLCLDINPVLIVASNGLFGLRFGAGVGCFSSVSKNLRIGAGKHLPHTQ